MGKSANSIVITSIFAPTVAVQKFAQLAMHQLVVAGDKKSPQDWESPDTVYLSIDAQEDLGFKLSSKLPYNHYGRKMMAYLYAIRDGAELIIDTDDDNIPYEDWSFPALEGDFLTAPDNLGFVNIYKTFTDKHIWPRGFPLDLITKESSRLRSEQLATASAKVGIWQGLADGDPDVDAIYRLIDNTECFFNDHASVVLGEGTLCPFNSQNTAIRRELFPLLYMPAYVTFRFTDILRGLVAQPIMWTHGYRLGFTKATVVQERNPHDYMRDFESEIPCYLHPNKVIEIVKASISPANSISENLYAAYVGLQQADIVSSQEIELLSLWLEDIAPYAGKQ
ncbi:STELLO glycosyltransferase family protein [Hymenobacter sp. BT491]|uniref:STELLO glycosyltransferase family protein n=1 Tax=Hymenobacter sp. BT491 TaxID=2766779 RepID=UPI001653C87E|nr:STELLO glycosyltransferase family protein [Hymenobacter sp. BT491]MBC6988284.1 DUF288 domain-containing protein [Hymenobacter sp. BT491]